MNIEREKKLKRAASKLAGLFKYYVEETHKIITSSKQLDNNIDTGLMLCEEIKEIVNE